MSQCDWYEDGRGVGIDGRVEDVGGSDWFKVLWIHTQGGERASVDNSLDLNDQRVEGVDVERLASRQRREMRFE